MLNDVYPELGRNLNNQVDTLLRFEEQVFRENVSKSGREWTGIIGRLPELSSLPEDQQPGIVAGLNLLKDWARSSSGRSSIPGALAFKLYNSHGLQEESLLLLSRLNGWTVDWTEFRHLMEQAQMATRLKISADKTGSSDFQCTEISDLPPTEWQCQDAYSRSEDGEYRFPPLEATALGLVSREGRLISQVSAGERASLVTDKSCFYYEAGGQVGDTGRLIFSSGSALVEQVRRVGDHIHHLIVVDNGCLDVGQSVEMILDVDQRLRTMANHTATHLLQAALKSVLKVTCQKSSHVTPDHLRFDFGLFQSDFHLDMISQTESTVKEWIQQNLPVERRHVPLHEAVAMDGITLLPGEAYPEVISLVRVGQSVSLEPCCGTHVQNTSDLQDFAILSLKSSGVGSRSIKAVTRSAATAARARASELECSLSRLERSVQQCSESFELEDMRVRHFIIDILPYFYFSTFDFSVSLT